MLGAKAESVRRLYRTSIEIHHAGGKYPAKNLHKIVSGILAIDVGWNDGLGESFRKNHAQLAKDKVLDCGLAVSGASFDIFNSNSTYTYGPSDNVLGHFAFRLLSRLQRIATVPAVDWSAYADRLTQPT